MHTAGFQWWLKLSNKLSGDMVKVAEVVSGRKMIGVGEGAQSTISDALKNSIEKEMR